MVSACKLNSFIPSENSFEDKLFKRRKGINIAPFQDLIGFQRFTFCRPLKIQSWNYVSLSYGFQIRKSLAVSRLIFAFKEIFYPSH